jgi:laminin alpha 3/5
VNFQNHEELTIIVHYYQPNYPNVLLDVKLDKTPIVGKLNAEYCPSLSGCRAIVKLNENGVNNTEYPNFNQINFKLAELNKNVWLEGFYLLWEYDQEKLNYGPVSMNDEFKDRCWTKDSSNIDYYTSEFCDKSVLTISGSYHGENASLPCDCNPKGAKSPEFCDFFGGQCDCYENIIGRSCTRCRTGYFGFPNCRKCNCTSGKCDPITGECIRPPNCMQDDKCNEGYHSLHPEYGCTKCNCSTSEGVAKGYEETCDESNGQCKCKPNTAGHKCDRCAAGYYNYPKCAKCNCNTNGTTSQQCDPNNGKCLCKANTMGMRCDQCKPGNFNLNSKNSAGNFDLYFMSKF